MKRKIKWQNGDVFVVKLIDGTFSVGQILDLQMSNIVRCSFFRNRFNTVDDVHNSNFYEVKNLISMVACTREQIDYGIWKIIDKKPIIIDSKLFPNEEFRENNWIGSKSYDASIIEEFLNAYHSLTPWDDWYDPNYLDQLLLDSTKKPKNLVLKNAPVQRSV
jgi:hypothetical protein